MNAVNPGDPNAPRFNAGSGFTPPRSWSDPRIRIPSSLNPSQESYLTVLILLTKIPTVICSFQIPQQIDQNALLNLMFIVTGFYRLVKDLPRVEPLKLFLLHIPNQMFKPKGLLR